MWYRQMRYVVRLEAYAALWEPEQPEAEHDHLLEIEQILDALDDAENASLGDDVYLKRHYDLCPRCYENFAKNPLGREIGRQMNYSGN
jgi:hypothetical protein